jgi:hypothetical protein
MLLVLPDSATNNIFLYHCDSLFELWTPMQSLTGSVLYRLLLDQFFPDDTTLGWKVFELHLGWRSLTVKTVKILVSGKRE